MTCLRNCSASPRRALKKDPGERYPTMTELLTDLKTLRQDLEFGEKIKRLHTAGGDAAGLCAPRLTRRTMVASLAAVGAMALAVAYFATSWLWPRDCPSRSRCFLSSTRPAIPSSSTCRTE